VSRWSGSYECLHKLRRWLDGCDKYHDSCRIPPFSPKRLLDVSKKQGRVFLVEGATANHARYIALSHCWGGNVPVQTTRGTYVRHTCGILLSSLPRTFRDAVSICLCLGIRYLWIDSLCIIQGDNQDWVEQAAEMEIIYASAYVTVAASASKDSSGGIFALRPTPPPVTIDATSISTEFPPRRPTFHPWRPPRTVALAATALQVTPSSSSAPESFDTVCPSLMDQHAEMGSLLPPSLSLHEQWPQTEKQHQFKPRRRRGPEPLRTRAWAFQERLLSTRIVHFTELELVFECKEHRCCECKPGRAKPITSVHGGRAERVPDMPDDRQAILDWCELVEKYSTLHLSFREDTLPALAGLARRFRKTKGRHYFGDAAAYHAGLWEVQIPFNLLWFVTPDHIKNGHAKGDESTPSWSWASAGAPVRHWPENRAWWSEKFKTYQSKNSRHWCVEKDPRFQFVGATLQPKGPDQYGRVSPGGSLRVVGYTFKKRSEGRLKREYPDLLERYAFEKLGYGPEDAEKYLYGPQPKCYLTHKKVWFDNHPENGTRERQNLT